MPDPRILLWDIENSPNLGYYYDRWKEGNIIREKEGWFMLSFAYQWLGEKDIHVRSLPDYPRYSRDRKNDRSLVHDLWSVLSQADITVAHNGDKHDNRKAYARFAYHKLPPPTPSKSIDTFKAAKKYFAFSANNLDHLAAHFNIGRKLPTTGFEMHERCMDGDMTAWPIMQEYNKHDVFLLNGVYKRLRPYMTNHPNLNHISRAAACPACQSPKIVQSGWAYVATGKKQRSTCRMCGHRFVNGKLERG